MDEMQNERETEGERGRLNANGRRKMQMGRMVADLAHLGFF